jgi:hypothetical protein
LNAEITMVNTALAPIALTCGNSLVLYRNTLPERYSITIPVIEVVAGRKSDSIFENQAGNDVLYYDNHGHLERSFQTGLFINALF